MAIVAQLIAAWDGSSRAQLTPAWVEDAPGLSITIDGDFERSCVNPALSSWDADFGDGQPIIRIQARQQSVRYTDGTLSVNRWIEPVARITGVNGVRPWVTFQPFTNPASAGNVAQTWITTQRAHYSYDGITWQPFLAPQISASELRFRPATAFEQDVVYVARSWPRSVTQVGNQIAALAAAHPTKVSPAPSAASFAPSLTTAYPAQDYVFAEVSAKTNELGAPIPATPLYGFAIDDAAFAGPKKLAVITGGIHAGEDVGELWLWETVDFLLNGTSAEALYAREHFRVLVYPLLNTPGRAGGYWRGGPDHEDDPNSEWYEPSPSHEFTPKTKAAILSDVAGAYVAWAIDFHAALSGTRAQLGIRTAMPSTVEYDSRVRSRYPTGGWSDYESRSIPLDTTSGTIRTFFTRELQPGLSMLHEVCDRPGSVTPAVMRPYAEASIGALADMDAAGWFDDPVAQDLAAVGISVSTGAAAPSVDVALSAIGFAISTGTAAPEGAATITLSAAGLAEAAAAAGLSAQVLLAGAGAAQAAGNVTLAAQLSAAAAGAAQAAGTATLTGSEAGQLAAGGSAQALGSAALVLDVRLQAAGSATASGSTTLDSGSTQALGASGAAQASGAGLLSASVVLTGAGFVQAMGAGQLAVQVPLHAAGSASASGTATAVDAEALLLIYNPAFEVFTPGRRYEVSRR